MNIKDIARIAGVSVSTVSRVLNDHPDVSAETCAKVRKVLDENNYIPNLGARILSQSETKNIGLVIRGMANPFLSSMIIEMEKKITEAGYLLYTQQIGSNDDELMTAALMERDKKLQGIIFLGGRLNYTKEEMTEIEVPYVFCSFDNRYGTLDDKDFSSVCIDDYQAAHETVETLYSYGHRRIAILLTGKDDNSVSQIRFEGYEKALAEHGISVDQDLIITTGNYYMESSYEAMKRRLAKGKDFTAVFVIADNMAIGAIRALADAGYTVPKDCSVVAIDGIALSRYMWPRLSTFAQPIEQMAGESAKQMIRMIEEPEKENMHLTVPIAFWEGETIARA